MLLSSPESSGDARLSPLFHEGAIQTNYVVKAEIDSNFLVSTKFYTQSAFYTHSAPVDAEWNVFVSYSSHVFLSPFDCKLIRLVNHYSRLETVTTCLWDALFSNKGPIRSRPYFVLVSWTGRPIHETKTKYSVVQIGPKSSKISGYLAKVTFVLWTETRASRVSFKQKNKTKQTFLHVWLY